MKQTLLLLASIFGLASCSTYNVPDSPQLRGAAVWAIMPMENNSNSPLASEKVEQILSTQLYKKGINAVMYPKPELNKLTDILDSSAKDKYAQNWLTNHPADYVITGSVEEWHYKSGLDGEPAVGLSLEVQSTKEKSTLWRATGSRGGWGRESVSGTGIIVVEELLNGLHIE